MVLVDFARIKYLTLMAKLLSMARKIWLDDG